MTTYYTGTFQGQPAFTDGGAFICIGTPPEKMKTKPFTKRLDSNDILRLISKKPAATTLMVEGKVGAIKFTVFFEHCKYQNKYLRFLCKMYPDGVFKIGNLCGSLNDGERLLQMHAPDGKLLAILMPMRF